MKLKHRYALYIKKNLGFMLCIYLVAGCKKFVQVPPPSTQIVTATVFNSISTATSALTAIYSNMYNNSESFNIANDQGLLSDELTNYSVNQTQLQFYTNSMQAIAGNGQWYNGYSYIYQANAVIDGLQNNGDIIKVIQNQLTGEAKFIRAFWHFYLTNEYGAVPLVTTTDYTINQSLPRASQPLVYNQIIRDLQDADSLLNANYVDGSDTTLTTDRIRPNKSAAEALLARVYLYVGKYDSASMEASKVINNNSLYELSTNLSQNMGSNYVFEMNSTEAIWQIGVPMPQGTSNTLDATYFILITAPNNSGPPGSSTISPQLLSAFEPGDLRMTNWIGVYTATNPTVNYYFPFKYQSYNTQSITEYTMVLRLAEQYLIRAEAEANLGDMGDAATDLNAIRNRAGLPPSPTLTASSTLGQADSAILHERQVELFTEWGHRWFDLNRTGAVSTVMGSPGNVYQYKNGGMGVWNANWELYPVPQADRTVDKNLTQNPGY
jgi:hypothetical protein